MTTVFSLCFLEPCPPNAEYIECGPACIPTCQEPSTNCSGSCISGCFCKPGFVFKGRRCVPLEKCGCLDDHNNYYEVREGGSLHHKTDIVLYAFICSAGKETNGRALNACVVAGAYSITWLVLSLFSARWGRIWWWLFKVVPLLRELHFGMCW